MVDLKNGKTVILEKQPGETPLQCLERFRVEKIAEGFAEFADMPMTYAGRLDPMASGALLVLLGEECKNKEKYLGLDKEYEVEILFGVETDTQDILGVLQNVTTFETINVSNVDLQNYVGKFTQKYPAFSSKTVAGKQLHARAREGTLPDDNEMPRRTVEIYSIEDIDEGAARHSMTGAEIARDAIARVSKVTGDFRQEKIIEGWRKFGLDENSPYAKTEFNILNVRVSCSAGTYMRSLAEKIGKDIKMSADIGIGALAFSIHRTKINGV